MEVKPQQLNQQLSKKLYPAYLIAGDEPLLSIEASSLIKKAAQEKGFSEKFRYFVDSANFDWSEILQQGQSLSLFSDRKIIEIQFKKSNLNEKAKKCLLEIITTCSKDCLLLLNMPKLDKKQKTSSWFKKITTAGAFIPIWPISLSQFPAWLNNRLQQNNLRIDQGGLELLIERTEGNLLAASQEIEKLKLLTDSHNISAEQVNESASQSSRYDVFNLMDAILGANQNCFAMLDNFHGEKLEPTILLWALSKELRLLSQLRAYLNHGMSLEQGLNQVAKLQKLPLFLLKKRQPLLQKALSRNSERELRLLLAQAASLDKAIKGVITADIWLTITHLVAKLAGFNAIKKLDDSSLDLQ